MAAAMHSRPKVIRSDSPLALAEHLAEEGCSPSDVFVKLARDKSVHERFRRSATFPEGHMVMNKFDYPTFVGEVRMAVNTGRMIPDNASKVFAVFGGSGSVSGYVMEYIEGDTLAKRRFPVEQEDMVFENLIALFGRMQGMGLVHGNINASNTIITPGLNPVVVDPMPPAGSKPIREDLEDMMHMLAQIAARQRMGFVRVVDAALRINSQDLTDKILDVAKTAFETQRQVLSLLSDVH